MDYAQPNREWAFPVPGYPKPTSLLHSLPHAPTGPLQALFSLSPQTSLSFVLLTQQMSLLSISPKQKQMKRNCPHAPTTTLAPMPTCSAFPPVTMEELAVFLSTYGSDSIPSGLLKDIPQAVSSLSTGQFHQYTNRC